MVSLNTLSSLRPVRQEGPGEGPALSFPSSLGEPLSLSVRQVRGEGAPGAERAGQEWRPGGPLLRP